MTEEEFRAFFSQPPKGQENFKPDTTLEDSGIFENRTVDRMEAKRIQKARDMVTDPLIDSLKESIHLTDETKANLIRLAELYLENMKDNILKDQFDLAEKYDDTTADEWTTFLTDRVVSTYLTKHKNAMLKASAENNLADPYARNKRDNLNLLKRLDEKEAEDKQQIVIIRIPDKYGDE